MSTAAPTLRWYSKKAARVCMALSAGGLRRVSGAGRDAAVVVRAVTYHRFGAVPRDPFCVDVAVFQRQMEWLAERRLAVSLADVEAFLAGERTLADGSVLVTIDDGCPSVVSRALPILSRLRIPAVLFVPAGELTETPAATDDDDSPGARISWPELAAVAHDGIDIGSHSWTHASLTRMALADAREQLVRSREELERRLERPVRAFAYPFGTRADYDDVIAAELPRAGYRLAFTSRHGAIAASADPFTLPRIKIEGGESSWMFRLATTGALDGWRVVDQTLWRLQASRG